MTIDETPRGSAGGGEGSGMRTSAHEIERYGGLFARRTRGMTSSAMRDMMAVTARPEVISLATGLPDTTTFPAEDFAALMSRAVRFRASPAITVNRSSSPRSGHGKFRYIFSSAVCRECRP